MARNKIDTNKYVRFSQKKGLQLPENIHVSPPLVSFKNSMNIYEVYHRPPFAAKRITDHIQATFSLMRH